MKKLGILSIAAIWSLSSSALFASALVMNFDSGGLLLKNSVGVNLAGGLTGTAYDGEVIQLGYFSGATSNGNNFSGNWTPITGEGSVNYALNTPYDTSVGDDPTAGFTPNNQFSIALVLDTAAGKTIPAGLTAGTIMSIRVYDKNTIAASTAFMTISSSSDLWKWPTVTTLTDPSSALNISFADPGIRAENRLGGGGTTSTPSGDPVSPSATSLNTTIPVVPEPASAALMLVGFVSLAARRRRNAK